MTQFNFQASFTEDANRLSIAASLEDFDIKSRHITIRFDNTSYDKAETMEALEKSLSIGTQNIELISSDYKYNMVAEPTKYPTYSDAFTEITYKIHGLTEEKL